MTAFEFVCEKEKESRESRGLGLGSINPLNFGRPTESIIEVNVLTNNTIYSTQTTIQCTQFTQTTYKVHPVPTSNYPDNSLRAQVKLTLVSRCGHRKCLGSLGLRSIIILAVLALLGTFGRVKWGWRIQARLLALRRIPVSSFSEDFYKGIMSCDTLLFLDRTIRGQIAFWRS